MRQASAERASIAAASCNGLAAGRRSPYSAGRASPSGRRPGRGDGHDVGQPPRVEGPHARDPGGLRGGQSRHQGRVHRHPGPRLPHQAADRYRRRGDPPTSSAMQEGSIITQVTAGGELPFIDLTGKVDISGLTDTARGQVEVDGKVYGTPAGLLHRRHRLSEADLRRARAEAAHDLAGAERRRPGAQGRR